MAQEINTRFAGHIPTDRADLLSLPGVSEYIAGAVRCFAWDQPEVLMDTNTVRITGRLLGWPIKDSSRRNARFRCALQALLDPDKPRAFNYALLDLAHLVCLKRQEPRCQECPLAAWCQYRFNKGEFMNVRDEMLIALVKEVLGPRDGPREILPEEEDPLRSTSLVYWSRATPVPRGERIEDNV